MQIPDTYVLPILPIKNKKATRKQNLGRRLASAGLRTLSDEIVGRLGCLSR